MQISISTNVDSIAVIRVSSTYNVTAVSFVSSSATPGKTDLVFRSRLDPTRQASISYIFQNQWSPSVVSIRPSIGHNDVATEVQIVVKVNSSILLRIQLCLQLFPKSMGRILYSIAR